MTHGASWAVIRRLSRRPAETCRRRHMPIARPRARSPWERALMSVRRQLAAREPMPPALLQKASLPLHGMFCSEGQGSKALRRRGADWEQPARVSISGSPCTRLGCDSPSRPAAWLGATDDCALASRDPACCGAAPAAARRRERWARWVAANPGSCERGVRSPLVDHHHHLRHASDHTSANVRFRPWREKPPRALGRRSWA